MKLDKNREPRLKISDDTGVIRYDENLIGKLLQKKPYIDFDYNHDFTIEISFNDYIPVSIKLMAGKLSMNRYNKHKKKVQFTLRRTFFYYSSIKPSAYK